MLLIPSISGMDHKFTAMFCKQVTWAIVNDKCSYFYKRLLPEDFKGGTPPQFPKSLLDDIVPKIMFQEPIHRSTFLVAWTENPPQRPPTLSLLPPMVANPFIMPQKPPQQKSLQEQMTHVHPWIANRMREYHGKFRGQVMMSKILVGPMQHLTNSLSYRSSSIGWQTKINYATTMLWGYAPINYPISRIIGSTKCQKIH